MKKMLTKMLAVAMAWAMLLSCTVMASATGTSWTAGNTAQQGETSQSGIGGEGQLAQGWGVTANSDTGRASLMLGSTGMNNYASGRATGKSHNEGRVPADVIRLVMPTVGKNALDMILDPHNLINATQAARYGGSSGAVFMEGTQVYFLNVISDGKAYYTNESQTLTIQNKSSVPVNVNLSLRANKGSGSDGFHFVDETKTLTPSGGATMRLALIGGDETKYVKEFSADSSAQMHTWFGDDGKPVSYAFLPLTFTNNGTQTLVGSTGQSKAYDKTSTAQSDGTFQFLTSDGALRKAIAELTAADLPKVELSVIIGSNGADANSNPESWYTAYPHDMGISTYSTGQIIKIQAYQVALTNTTLVAEIQPEYLTRYSNVKSTGYILNTTVEVPVSVIYYKSTDTARKNPVAAMYFNVKAANLGTQSATAASAEISVTPLTSSGRDGLYIAAYADIKSEISEAEYAYTTAYDKAAGYYKVFREENPTEYNKFAPADERTSVKSAGYSTLDFHLKAEIGGYESAWDITGGDIQLDLIWDVYGMTGSVDKKPTATVKTAATNTSNTGKTATISYAEGTGKYATYVPYKYTGTVNGSSTEATISPNTSTKTFTIAATTTNKTMTNVKVSFKDPTDATKTVSVKLSGTWYTGT